MRYRDGFPSATRRGLLKLLGMGAAGAAVGTLGSARLFAKQFVGDATRADLPEMVYDPASQMMVDPATRTPIYTDSNKIRMASGLPTVTAGCSDCPKKDDDGE